MQEDNFYYEKAKKTQKVIPNNLFFFCLQTFKVDDFEC